MRTGDKIPVKDHSELVRDPDTGAILNTDRDQIKAYRRKKAQERRLDSMEKRIKALEDIIERLTDDHK